MIDPNRPVPLHEQLAGLLRGRISSGELTGRIPSIKHLAQEYGLSHRTVERALRTLKDEGLVVSLLGRGYFVAGSGLALAMEAAPRTGC
jgi:DNA-binding GntR family transcriptional regulator